jgi:MFS family permease
MSFALGFYEIFSYAIPGFLYVLIANGFRQLMKLPHLDFGGQAGNFGYVVLMAIFSYIAGHIADPIAYRWYQLFNRQDVDDKVIAGIKNKHPELNVEFRVGDRRLLYSFIKHKNLPLAEYLDKFNAIGILLHNLSLGLFLFALTQIAYIFITGQILGYGLGALLGLAFSFVVVKRSALFKGWYIQGTFEQALHYGTSVEKMFKEEWPAEKSPEPAPPPAPAPAKKPRTRTKATNSKPPSTK